jgi:hypothetical protein
MTVNIRRIPKCFRSHPRLASIDLYYSFWVVDLYTGSASTFTIEPVPMEFQGKLYASLDSLGPLFEGYPNWWVVRYCFAEHSSHIFACVWQVLKRFLAIKEKFPSGVAKTANYPLDFAQAMDHYFQAYWGKHNNVLPDAR